MNRPLLPGEDGESLPAGEWVLRLAVPSMDADAAGRASAAMFELSSSDRAAREPRLSVWAEGLTTPEQAWTLMGSNPKYRLALRLAVDEIRKLRPEPDALEIPSLDVVWDPLRVTDHGGRAVPDPRPGAEGHAGITGLARGGALTRLHAKSLRRQLAMIARVELFP